MGTFKNVGKLSWLRVFAAGHEVPYYRKFTMFFLLEVVVAMSFGVGEW